MARPLYASLIKTFLALTAPDQPPLAEDPGALQFTVGDHTCTVFALEGGRQLVLESEVMGLAELGPDRTVSALRLLHGLNWAARGQTGIVALIDSDNRVLVSKTLEIRMLDAHQLEERMAALLDAAASLGTLLRALPQGQDPAVRPSGPPAHGQFA